MLPKRLKAYEEKAKLLLEKGAVGEIEFSEGTYQIQIAEKDGMEERVDFSAIGSPGPDSRLFLHLR